MNREADASLKCLVPTVATSREYEGHFQHLANTLRGFLAIYEGPCRLKQVWLPTFPAPLNVATGAAFKEFRFMFLSRLLLNSFLKTFRHCAFFWVRSKNCISLPNRIITSISQIKLEVEILPAVEVKKALVDFAKTHKTCKLILGSNKHFTVR